MKLKYFLMIIGTYCLARILLPPLFLQINKTTTSFSRKGTPVSDREHRQEPQKRNTTNTQENIYFTEHHSINEQQLPESPKKQPIMNKMKFDVKKIGLEIKKVVFVLILLLPVFFLTIINLEKFASIFSNNEGEDIQSFGSFGASFVLVTLLWTILWGGIMSTVLWMASTLKKIWEEREKEFSGLIIYTGAFMVITLFLSREKRFSIDNVADMLVAGELLSYPVVLIVIFPIFMLAMVSITELLRKPVIQQTGKEVGNLLLNMAKDSLISIIKFLQFVSSDFLVSIAELVEDDIEYPVSNPKKDASDTIKKDDERHEINDDENEKKDCGNLPKDSSAHKKMSTKDKG